MRLFGECLFGLLWKDQAVAEGLVVTLKMELEDAFKD